MGKPRIVTPYTPGAAAAAPAPRRHKLIAQRKMRIANDTHRTISATLPRELADRIEEIATWEDRPRNHVFATLAYLGISIYERMAANLAGHNIVQQDCPTPVPSPLRLVSDRLIGRRLLEAEATRFISFERDSRERETQAMASNLETYQQRRKIDRTLRRALPDLPEWENLDDQA